MTDPLFQGQKLSQYQSEDSEIEQGLNDESTAADDMFLDVSSKANDVTASDVEDNNSSTFNNNNFSKKKYCMISQEIREQFIERVLSKKTTIKQAAIEFGIKFSTSKAILQTYKKEGRIGKKKTRNRKKKDELDISSCEEGCNETQITSSNELNSNCQTELVKRTYPFQQSNFLNHQVKQIKIDEKTYKPVVQSQQSNHSIQTVLQGLIANQMMKQAQQQKQQQQQQSNEQIMKALIANAVKHKLMQQEQQKQEILKQIFLSNQIQKNQSNSSKEENDNEKSNNSTVNPEVLKFIIIQQQMKNKMNQQQQQNIQKSEQRIEEENLESVENRIDVSEKQEQSSISLQNISETQQNKHIKTKKVHIIQYSDLSNLSTQLSLFSEIQN